MTEKDVRSDVSMRCAAVAALAGPVAAVALASQLGWDKAHAVWLSWPIIAAIYFGLRIMFVPKDDD